MFLEQRRLCNPFDVDMIERCMIAGANLFAAEMAKELKGLHQGIVDARANNVRPDSGETKIIPALNHE